MVNRRKKKKALVAEEIVLVESCNKLSVGKPRLTDTTDREMVKHAIPEMLE